MASLFTLLDKELWSTPMTRYIYWHIAFSFSYAFPLSYWVHRQISVIQNIGEIVCAITFMYVDLIWGTLIIYVWCYDISLMSALLLVSVWRLQRSELLDSLLENYQLERIHLHHLKMWNLNTHLMLQYWKLTMIFQTNTIITPFELY